MKETYKERTDLGKRPHRFTKPEYDTFNIMGAVLSDIANLLDELRWSLTLAYRGSYTSYRNALAFVKVFLDIINAYYSVAPDRNEVLKTKIKLVELYQEAGELQKGAEVMGDIMQEQIQTLKQSNVIFPRLKKSMTFHDWVKNETS